MAVTGAIEWLAVDDEKEMILTAEPETGWLMRIYRRVIGVMVPEGLL